MSQLKYHEEKKFDLAQESLGWINVEIVRNQVVLGPSHSGEAILILHKIHDIALQDNVMNNTSEGTFSFM